MTTRISLCMIAKDEEQNIGRCLQSVAGVVDEIIVVDTGSSDKTCLIAQQFGAKVHTFAWNNNFSDARNASLDLATGEWILFLDADEELAKESGAILRKAIQSQEVEGFLIKIVNLSGNDNFPETSADMVFRLFRNKPDYRFRGAVHEQIFDVITEKIGGFNYQYLNDAVIYHCGYLNSHVKAKDKLRRNRVLLEKELRDKPDDPLVRFQYAVELCRAQEYLPAAEEFEKLAGMINVREVNYGPKLMRYIVHAYIWANKLPAALTAVQLGVELFPDYADLYFYGGQIYYQLKEYGLAYEYFQKALQMPEQPVHYASFAGIQGYRSLYYLGQIAEKFCNEEEALQHYIACLRDNNSFITALDNILGILQPRINPDDTKNAINKLCDFSLPQAKLLIGRLLFKHGAYVLAGEQFAEVPEQFWSEELLLEKAICFVQQRRSTEALNILEAIEGQNKFNPNARFNKLLCFWFAGDMQRVREVGEQLLVIGLSADTAAVIRLLKNIYITNTLSSIGGEGMTLVLGILKRALDLGELKLCSLLLSDINPQSLQDYYLQLGEIFYQYGYEEIAEQYLRRFLQKNSGADRTYDLLAEITERQGLYPKAADYYRQALQLEPQEPKYYIKLLKLYEKQHSELLQQATDKYPEFAALGMLSAKAETKT